MNKRVADELKRIVWNQMQVSQKPDIKPHGKNWLMDTMPFHAVLKEKLTDDKPLQYLCEGKHISFKPVGGLSTTGLLRADKRSVAYKDGLGAGISLEVEVSQAHWKKLIKIDSLNALGDLTGREFIEFTFEVETDFDIPEGENKKPRIKLGGNSYIEVSQAWDSTPQILDEETGETSENKIIVKSFFKRENGKLFFIKQISVEWLKTAIFPVWSDVDITYGTAQEFGDTNHSIDYCQCCEIDTNKFVVVGRDLDDGRAGDARVGTVSGTTISWGTASEFCSQVYPAGQIGVCKLDTDKFVVVYSDDDEDDHGYARVGTVSGTTISWGTAKEFHNTLVEFPSCCPLGIDKFAISYKDADGSLGTVCICTVSTTTITAGTPVAFGGTPYTCRCCQLGIDKFVAVYSDASDGYKPKACAFTVSTRTPTPGIIKEISAITSYLVNCCQLDTDKFVVAWADSDGNTGEVEICTVSGTTITEGAQVEFVDVDNPPEIALTKIDVSHFVIVYEDAGDSQYGTSRYCSFADTTITLDGEEIFSAAQVRYLDVCLIGTSKVVVVYRDDADVNDIGEAIIGDTPAEEEEEPKHTFRLHPRPGHRMEFHPNLKLG